MESIVNSKAIEEIVFDNTDELSAFLGNFWKEKTENLKENEYYSIALSGGSTPIKIFTYLSENFKDKIDWNKIKFFWGDERCVMPNHSDSNYKLAKDNLFNHIHLDKKNIFRIEGEVDPYVEAKAHSKILENNLKIENGFPVFDFILLGLGEDGHTASIFPHQIELFNSPNYCEVAQHPDSGQKRITITGNVINNAKTIAFAVIGKKKALKVYEILNNKASARQYPAALVNPNNGNLIWLLDQESAKIL